MRVYVAAAMMTAHIAVAAPAPASPASVPAPVAAQQDAAVIPDDWAAAPPPDKSLVRRAIKESIEAEKAIAIAESKEKAIPRRFTMSSRPDQDKYEKFAEGFDDAKVPGCLSPSGLKRQPTFIFGGLLALPFIAVAAVRGKCN
jgi:hypothetical protein